MGANTEPGWYYVGKGQLRYRDEVGWTAYEMDTRDVRAAEWPPATPAEMLRELRASGSDGSSRKFPSALRRLRRASRSAGRHRSA
ncbi:hypothetical protein [Terrabacter terrigena]|uniref:Uncharacterized protein n=1 Tax=Terrabacter terrigena TaxID=574718 RepID=A0ABW3MW47_9MICO